MTPFGVARFSKPARRAVSGYLPIRLDAVGLKTISTSSLTPQVSSLFQWTAGESNPDFLVASQASSRWTSGPGMRLETVGKGFLSSSSLQPVASSLLRVTGVGVEPTKSPGSGHRRAAVVAGRFAKFAYPASRSALPRRTCS